MAFDSIRKIAQNNQEKGITTSSVIENSTNRAYQAELASNNSVWTANEGDKSSNKVVVEEQIISDSSDNIFAGSIDTSAYEKSLNDAIDRANTIAKYQAFGNFAVGMANALGNLGIRIGGSSSSVSSAPSVSQFSAVQTASKPAIGPFSEDFTLSNVLDSAIDNFSNKPTSENWDALVNQIALAKNDKDSLKTYMDDKKQVIKDCDAKEDTLKQELDDAKKDKIEKGKAVDAVREGIQAATRKKTITEKEIPAQEGIIKASQDKVSSASSTYSSVESAQNAIIAQKEPDKNAMKTETYTETVNGKPVQKQRQVPDTAKREAAEQAIKAAEDKIKKAKEEYEKVLLAEVGSKEQGAEPTENSVQGKAKAKIDDLKAEVAKKDEIIKASGSTEEELAATQKAYMDAIDKINTKNEEIDKLKEDKNTAQLRYNQAETQDKVLDKQIAKAEKLMTSKK